MDDKQYDDEYRGLLNEDQLKHLSRHIKTVIPQNIDLDQANGSIKELHFTLERIFEAASNSSLKATHRVAAWNALCALIDQCANLDYDILNNVVFVERIWDRAFKLYLEQGHLARPKSSKQLLTTLSTAFKKGSSRPEVYVAKPLITGITCQEDHRRTKACLQALSHLLLKEVLSLEDVRNCIREHCADAANSSLWSTLQYLLAVLLAWVGKADLGSVVAQVVTVILDRQESLQNSHDPQCGITASVARRAPIWVEPLTTVLGEERIIVEDLRIHIFPALFKRSLADYVSFLEAKGLHRLTRTSSTADSHIQDDTELNDGLLYAALQAGKELGLVSETTAPDVSISSTSVQLPVRCIGRMLRQSSRNTRLTGLSLLTTSHAATRPFPPETFRMLRRYLYIFFGDTDANFRSEVFSLMQKLMDRLRAVTAVLGRQANTNEAAAQTLHNHRSFLEWLLQFLSWEVRPTASYQRHISALKTLSVLARSGLDQVVPSQYLSKAAVAETKWPFQISIMTPGLRRLLLDLLMDPFDDVRQMSAAILFLYSAPGNVRESQHGRKGLGDVIDRAENRMLATGRADQADGVAHMYALLFRESQSVSRSSTGPHSTEQSVLLRLVESLARILNTVESSLATAPDKYPMHGLLTSLRYVLTQSQCSLEFGSLPHRLVDHLHAVWEAVKPVLCNDAPEGYLPENPEDMPEMSTKDTLSYSWRALKESSMLLGTIVAHESLNYDSVLALSNLCFTQLAELRHRGAFSTVAQTWITCCVRCRGVKGNDGQTVLQSWYDDVLQILNRRVTINTRRSAGIPSLICGLLIADQTGHLVAKAFEDLAIIARQPVDSSKMSQSSLPQVHALNCMKDMLKNTRLREQSEFHVPRSLRLAADSLRSEAWAVRNCGLMLFRAVIDRLLGTSGSHPDDDAVSSQRISAQQYPELLNIVLDLLTASDATSTSRGIEGVFPALQLLQRSAISKGRLDEAKRAVWKLTSSPSWHIRDKAARTYAAVVCNNGIATGVKTILATEGTGQNALHGSLLCARYLVAKLGSMGGVNSRPDRSADSIRRAASDAEEVFSLLTAMTSASHFFFHNTCPITKSAYVDLVTDCRKHARSSRYQGAQGQDTSPQKDSNRSTPLSFTEELHLASIHDQCFGGNAALRRSLARAVSYEVDVDLAALFSESEGILSPIRALARSDPDACSYLFLEIQFAELPEGPKTCSKLVSLISAASTILDGVYELKLKCEVQRFLLWLADLPWKEESSSGLQALVPACACTSRSIGAIASQTYADQSLQLQALVVEAYLAGGLQGPLDMETRVRDWITSCSAAVRQEDAALYTREAAAMSISRIKSTWRCLEARSSPDFRILCLSIYDLLNDDDEDIRLLAARSTARLVASCDPIEGEEELEPFEASQNLLTFMVGRWPADRDFAKEALLRAFGTFDPIEMTVAEQLRATTVVDTALFAEEKPNLYIDEARETKAWSQVLQIQPTTIPQRWISDLARWVFNGLNALADRANTESDGGLGWSTKPEAFVLGLQVLYGTEVLLHLVARGMRLPVRPSTLNTKLFRLTAAARYGCVNCLWIQEMERIAALAVVRCIADRKKLLATVSGAIWKGKRPTA
ncbi:hypothetical protein LTR37_005284 [Vermiconidia calcicola]|uniref:Uncharacterized protein n=1 Tax=Vermiconidia calcicola TaxID=1690605 RepID=A0ACC3NLB0_9PEZI|nr:hypothetical protein LTR37_005284 [Vermiconidia calcicola]